MRRRPARRETPARHRDAARSRSRVDATAAMAEKFPSLRRHDPDQVRRVRPYRPSQLGAGAPLGTAQASQAGRGQRGKPAILANGRGYPAPGGERLVEDRLARGAFLEGEDGALAGLVDAAADRSSPRSCSSSRLVVTSASRRRKGDPEEAVGDLGGGADQRLAAGFLGRLQHEARHAADPLAGEIGRRVDHHLDQVARRQRLVGILAERELHLHRCAREPGDCRRSRARRARSARSSR